MATYPVINSETGETKEVVMSVHDWDQWKADNPEWRLFSLTQPNDVHQKRNQLIHNIKKAINISKLKLPKNCILENFEISQNHLIVVSSGPKNCRNIFVFSLGDFSLIGNVVLEHD